MVNEHTRDGSEAIRSPLSPTQSTMLFQVLGSNSDIYAIRQRIDISRLPQ